MNHAAGPGVRAMLLAGIAMLLAFLLVSASVASQTRPPQRGLIAADPAPNALLAAGPDRILLNFSEAVNPATISLRLLSAGAVDVPLRSVAIDPANPARVIAEPSGTLFAGNFTVVWAAHSADTDAQFAGAYPFRTGVIANPGAARLNTALPAFWAVVSRWLVFLGAAIALGGFGWGWLLASRQTSRGAGSLLRTAAMACGAFVALVATIVPPLLDDLLPGSSAYSGVAGLADEMSLGWWVQTFSASALLILCLAALARARASYPIPAVLNWAGLGVGLITLVGLSLTSHASSPFDAAAIAVEIVHQWATALWVSGLLYLAANWRDLGTDIARFRTVRWIGGLLLVIAIVTGLARSWWFTPEPMLALTSAYGRILTAKIAVVLVTLVIGVLAIVLPRRSHANQASSSLGAQGVLALTAAFLAAYLALMAAPDMVAPLTRAGVDLTEVVALDPSTFGQSQGLLHLMTQPATIGAQTVVVRLTDGSGRPLPASGPATVQVDWQPLSASELRVSSLLQASQPDQTSIFVGSAVLPADSWWQADVVLMSPNRIASRTRFWLVIPDPNSSGHGPEAGSDATARGVFDRGLASLTALRSVLVTRAMNDGAGELVRLRKAIDIGYPEQNQAPSIDETVLDTTGGITSQERTVGEQRWVLLPNADWMATDPAPVKYPRDWGTTYATATGFQLGPRDDVDGEICQIVTFWLPEGPNPDRSPRWIAWWVGLASGELRREAMISMNRYQVSSYSKFDAPLGVGPPPPPATFATPAAFLATPAPAASAIPAATPGP